MITRVRVTNFKCLRDVEVPLAPLTVLIGKNDTGKTSFLEALRMLGRLSSGEPFSGLGLDQVVTHGADAPQIEWFVHVAATERNLLPGKATYQLAMLADRSAPALVAESCVVPGIATLTIGEDAKRKRRVFAAREGEWSSEDGVASIAQTGLSRARHYGNAPVLRAVSGTLSSTVLYRLDPRRLARESAIVDDPHTVPQLAYDGFGLPGVLDYLLGVARSDFDRIESELRSMLPFVRNVYLRPTKLAAGVEEGGRLTPPTAGKRVAFALEPGGAEIAAPQVSDGVLLFLAYLTLIHGPNAPAVVLLEEPENGVHPRRLKDVVGLLSRLTSKDRGPLQAQVVLATHSPYLLDYVPPESVLVFGRRADGDTVVKRLSDLPKVAERIAAGLSVGEMWFNVGEDDLLADALKAS